MRISAALTVESLLRDLRLAGHALAESAELKLLRAVRRRAVEAAPAAGGRDRDGGEA